MPTTIPHVTVTRRPDGAGFVIRCAACLHTTLHPTRSNADLAAHTHTLEHTRVQADPKDQVF